MSKVEYDAARTRSVFFDRSACGRLQLTGADAIDLLHRTTTADLNALEVGRLAPSLIQSETARILDGLLVLRAADRLLIVTGPGKGEDDAAWIDRMIIMDDVTIESLTDATRMFELCGPESTATIEALFGAAAATLAPGRWIQVDAPGGATTIFRTSSDDQTSWGLIVPRDEEERTRAALIGAGAVAAGADVDESLRLERAIPITGRELTPDINPLEARLSRAISFQKGCYPGQEVIARMITYKSLKRLLVSFELSRPVEPPPPGTSWPLLEGGAMAGRLTSAAWSYGEEKPLGLGYLKRELDRPGAKVTFNAPDGPLDAIVRPFPRSEP